ncbi:MAG: STT3 domain-containing protein [Candidatus Pacearchaeota archaeon]
MEQEKQESEERKEEVEKQIQENKEKKEQENKKEIKIFENKWSLIVFVMLIAIVALSIYLRTQNIPYLKDITTGNYTLGPDLDPFLYLRHAREIVSGKLQDPDMMRAAPLGCSNYAKTNLMPWAIVAIYKILDIFFAPPIATVEFAAIIAPVIFFSLTLVVFFIFMLKLFSFITDKRKSQVIALIATAFYAVIPEMLHRTTAGIPEIESLGMLWFWLAFFCFVSAWQSKKVKKIILFSILAGLFTGLMIFTWGGFRYIFMIIALTSFLAFLFNKEKKKNFLIFTCWLIPALIFFIAKAGVMTIIKSITDAGFGLAVFLILFVDIILFKTKLREKLKRFKLPESIITLIVIAIFSFIVALIVNPGLVRFMASRIVEGLLYPFGRGRIGLTVAENRAPFLVDLIAEFSPIVFWLFFFSSIFLFYEAIKHFRNKKVKINLFLGFIVFVFLFLFSRFSATSFLNGENLFSKILYFSGLIVFAIIVLASLIRAKEETLEDFENINFAYLLLISSLFWTFVSIRGAIRLFFIISPFLTILLAFLPLKLLDYAKTKDETQKIVVYSIVVLIALLLLVSFIRYEKITKNAAKYTIPGPYQQQWQKAMAWVRNNTPKDAIFVHWWDYGYWIQTIGERATVTDGGHPHGFWDHTTARYLMTAQEEKTALQLCKAHNVSYFLIDSTDIGKYTAYSSIGSDASGKDRLSWISTFFLDERQTQETRNETLYVYVGGTLLDQDFIYKELVFPMQRAGIGAFIVHADKNKIKSIEAIVIYNKQQFRIPVRYFYLNNKLYDLGDAEALQGCLYFVPTLTQRGLNNLGAAMYLSEKAMNALWVKLYLLNETKNFELVHSEDALLIQQLKTQYNLSIGSFLIANELLGPIKIFKVNYPEDIEVHTEYLQTEWSETKGPFAPLDYLGT